MCLMCRISFGLIDGLINDAQSKDTPHADPAFHRSPQGEKGAWSHVSELRHDLRFRRLDRGVHLLGRNGVGAETGQKQGQEEVSSSQTADFRARATSTRIRCSHRAARFSRHRLVRTKDNRRLCRRTWPISIGMATRRRRCHWTYSADNARCRSSSTWAHTRFHSAADRSNVFFVVRPQRRVAALPVARRWCTVALCGPTRSPAQNPPSHRVARGKDRRAGHE